MRVICAALVCAGMVSCSRPSLDVVARVGDRAITLAEVDAKWQDLNSADQLKVREALYAGRREALDAIIADSLFTKAARAQGLSLEQYLAREIPRRIRPLTDADIQSFYVENQERMGDRSVDDARPAIAQLLQQRRQTEARESLLAELRRNAGPTEIALEPPRQDVDITSTDPVRGPRSARVTIVEFSDYQCPFCGRLAPVLAKVRATYGDRVRIVWKDFPLEEIHPRALKLAEAARCAGEHGKYWEFHDRVFSNQAAAADAPFENYARDVGLVPAEFAACINSGRHAKDITESVSTGERLGVGSTPTLFINGRPMAGTQPFDVLARVIDDELARPASLIR